MPRPHQTRRQLALACTLSVAALQAVAQGASQAPTVTARLAFDLEVNDNFDLREDSLGTATIGTTRLSFGYNQQTPVDSVAALVSGVVRASDLPEIGQEVVADDPRLNLTARRTVDDNTVGLTLFFNRVNLDFFDPLDDIDEDGQFDESATQGERTAIRSAFDTTINGDGPVTVGANLRFVDISFTDLAEDDDQQDRQTIAGGVNAGFDLTPTLTLTSAVNAEREDVGEGDNSIRLNRNANVGFNARVNPRASVNARIGFTQAEADRNDNEKTEDGVTGNIGFAIDEPRGQFRGNAGSTINENGQLVNFSLGRSLQLRNANFNGDLGVTIDDDGEQFATGNISYGFNNRRSSFGASFNQQVGVDEDGDNVINTFASVNFGQQLTRLTSLNLNLAGGLSRQADADRTETNERVNFTAQINRRLTEDWTANFGYRARYFDDDDQDPANSNAVFVGIARDFAAVR